MEAVKELKSFVKQVMARLKGDNDQVIAEKNFRLADAAVEGQLAKLKGKKVRAEILVSTEQDKLECAIYPTELIGDDSAYNRNIVERQENVDKAEDDLKDIENSIDYFTKLKTKINS